MFQGQEQARSSENGKEAVSEVAASCALPVPVDFRMHSILKTPESVLKSKQR